MEHDSNYYNVECPICGKKFHLKPYRIKRAKINYCSQVCHNIAKIEYMSGEKNHQYGLRMEKNASWKGGVSISQYGYRQIHVADHPFGDKNTGFVFEHRLIAEKYLLTDENSIEINGKKYLKPDYVVHHKDFNRLNNELNNLVVMTKQEHQSLHSKLNVQKKDKRTGRFMSNKILFKRTTETAIIPTKGTKGSAGFDLYVDSSEPIRIKPSETIVLNSGIAVKMPDGYYGMVFARSGISTKRGLRPATCVSVIDNDYTGQIAIPTYNDSNEVQTIDPYERIAQLVIAPYLTFESEEAVECFEDTERGNGGFGSTGR